MARALAHMSPAGPAPITRTSTSVCLTSASDIAAASKQRRKRERMRLVARGAQRDYIAKPLRLRRLTHGTCFGGMSSESPYQAGIALMVYVLSPDTTLPRGSACMLMDRLGTRASILTSVFAQITSTSDTGCLKKRTSREVDAQEWTWRAGQMARPFCPGRRRLPCFPSR